MLPPIDREQSSGHVAATLFDHAHEVSGHGQPGCTAISRVTSAPLVAVSPNAHGTLVSADVAKPARFHESKA